MKKVTKFFIAACLVGMCNWGYAQYYASPKKDERVLETISVEEYRENGVMINYATKEGWYRVLKKHAQNQFPDKVVDIRELEVGKFKVSNPWGYGVYYGPAVGKVVYTINPAEDSYTKLLPAINKAMQSVPEGSRTAIDQINVTNSMDKETFKDHIIDVILEKGYRVVAKEYLEKLYKEQQDQQSGIYNEKTTVQENNFSAVGYFINVKVTETSIRVQVVNVSTGEYEGNATEYF